MMAVVALDSRTPIINGFFFRMSSVSMNGFHSPEQIYFQQIQAPAMVRCLQWIWLHDMKKNRMTGWLFGFAVHQCGGLPGDQPGPLLNGDTCIACCPEERFY